MPTRGRSRPICSICPADRAALQTNRSYARYPTYPQADSALRDSGGVTSFGRGRKRPGRKRTESFRSSSQRRSGSSRKLSAKTRRRGAKTEEARGRTPQGGTPNPLSAEHPAGPEPSGRGNAAGPSPERPLRAEAQQGPTGAARPPPEPEWGSAATPAPISHVRSIVPAWAASAELLTRLRPWAPERGRRAFPAAACIARSMRRQAPARPATTRS